ncbi:hypothetical protein [Rhizomonospora bruguierae]|uniref:hypothetical protein n=1 Tax=Rhizomonospora bruguierae TaxID=1581705 RepID=UPI001BCFB05A|nr:hypothetical protein [Micromonospora sp. NBRC 107566]
MATLMGKAAKIQELALEKKVREYEQWINATKSQERNAKSSAHSNWPDFVQTGDPIWNSFSTSLDWIPQSFQPFTQPDPSKLTTLETDLTGIETNLGSRTIGKINTVRGTVEKWTGDAAYAFRKYSEGWDQVTKHQASIAGVLARAAKDMRSMYEAVDQNVNVIADKTIASLQSLDHSGGKEFKEGLTIAAGVVATAVGFVASGGTGGVLLGILAAAGDAGYLASSLVKPGKEPASLGGHTVDEVLSNMAAALSRVHTDISQAEQTVIRALRAMHSMADGHPSEFWIRPPQQLVGLRPDRTANDGLIPPAG